MVHSVDLELVFPETQDCEQLKIQIDRLLVNKDYWVKNGNESELNANQAYLDLKKKYYDKKDCGTKVSKIKSDLIQNVTDIYGAQDKARIEAESKYQVKQRVFIGILVLLGALFIIRTFGKKRIE